MKRILLKHLEQAAKHRPTGYVMACLASGKVEGKFLLLTPEAYRSLRARFPDPRREPLCRSCPQFWIEQSWCMFPECKCPDKVRHLPWLNMLRCPVGRWF